MSDTVDPTRVSQSTEEPARGPSAMSGGYSASATKSRRATLARLWAFARVPLTLLRFLIRRFLWVTIRLGRGVWRHPTLTLALIIAVFLAFRGYERYLVPQASPGDPGQYTIAEAIPPPRPVAEYLSAQRKFDADAMWNTYSEQAKAANLAQGSSLQTLRQTTHQMQLQGLQFGDSHYIGGYRTEQGGSAYYFYVTGVQDPQGHSADIYQIFTADSEGKVMHVDQPQVTRLTS